MKKKDFEWKFIYCRVLKQDEERFIDALSKLHAKCLVCGVLGYSKALADMKIMFPTAV